MSGESPGVRLVLGFLFWAIMAFFFLRSRYTDMLWLGLAGIGAALACALWRAAAPRTRGGEREKPRSDLPETDFQDARPEDFE
jgi:hypothetical protein